jgi:hypothetical protein
MLRNSKHFERWLVIAVTIVLVCCTQAQAGKPVKASYTIVPFMPQSIDTVRSVITDLNEAGQAVGIADVDLSPAGSRAVHYEIVTDEYTVLHHRAGKQPCVLVEKWRDD